MIYSKSFSSCGTISVQYFEPVVTLIMKSWRVVRRGGEAVAFCNGGEGCGCGGCAFLASRARSFLSLIAWSWCGHGVAFGLGIFLVFGGGDGGGRTSLNALWSAIDPSSTLSASGRE